MEQIDMGERESLSIKTPFGVLQIRQVRENCWVVASMHDPTSVELDTSEMDKQFPIGNLKMTTLVFRSRE